MDYINRKNLADMGITQSLSDLDDFEVKYLNLIHSEFKRIEHERQKRQAKVKHGRH